MEIATKENYSIIKCKACKQKFSAYWNTNGCPNCCKEKEEDIEEIQIPTEDEKDGKNNQIELSFGKSIPSSQVPHIIENLKNKKRKRTLGEITANYNKSKKICTKQEEEEQYSSTKPIFNNQNGNQLLSTYANMIRTHLLEHMFDHDEKSFELEAKKNIKKNMIKFSFEVKLPDFISEQNDFISKCSKVDFKPEYFRRQFKDPLRENQLVRIDGIDLVKKKERILCSVVETGQKIYLAASYVENLLKLSQ